MNSGLLDFPWWGVVAATLIMTHITIVAVTVYLHRSQAHRALDLHPVVSHFFRFWLWLTTGMVTKEWVAVHRKHHAKCETPDDPHSPQVRGIRKVFWEGSELYRTEATDQETLARYGHGTPDDWIERNLYTRYSMFGVLLMLLLNVLLFGVIGITVFAVQMLWIPIWAAGVINGIGHYWGYRNYESQDASRNILPWGILIGGEELHNNHHAFSSSAKLSSKRWEFDIGWAYIQLLAFCHLARVKKVAPVPRQLPGKQVIDLDTLRAVVLNRLHIMAEFARTVVIPVMRLELERMDNSYRQFLKRHRRLLLREEGQMNERERDHLQDVLKASQTLRTVHDYRKQLQALWSRTTASHDSLLAALQDWCNQAEASGIQALQDFARSLRTYSLQPA
ncbi:MAG: fatty acid desaturase [Gammaproteobacteria bacterium]